MTLEEAIEGEAAMRVVESMSFSNREDDAA